MHINFKKSIFVRQKSSPDEKASSCEMKKAKLRYDDEMLVK